MHHSLPGIVISLATGATAILTRSDGGELWLSLPFGIGAGLTLDESALLLERDNPYWGSERMAFAQAAAGAVAAAAMAADFYRRGHVEARVPDTDSGTQDEDPENQTKEPNAMSKTAREIMSDDCTCIGENDSVLDAAKKLAELGVGSMPICGEDDRLKGMLTDRDIVVKVLAQDKDPASTKAGELGVGDGEVVTIGADDSVDEALATMSKHQVRRLPVIDGHDLVGIVSQADIARNIDEEKVGDLVEAISQ
jgi:CBS domain-containing protein